MATRDLATEVREDHRTTTVTWEGLTQGDDGRAISFGYSPERTIQVFGTFAGAVLRFEGSLETMSPSKWAALTDPQGNPLEIAADGIEMVMENTAWVRPVVVGGAAGTDLTVILFSRFK